MKKIFFLLLAALAITSCRVQRQLTVTPVIMHVKDGAVSFTPTGPSAPLHDSLDGKQIFLIKETVVPKEVAATMPSRF